MISRLVVTMSLIFISQVCFARPVLDCKMKANSCTMSGASVILPWASIPDAAQYPYRQQISGPFEVLYGYEQATGDFAEGNLIIRDQDPQIGAYWGFVPQNESTYFAMISGTASKGFRMGVKGCASSPRVWSASCRVTSEEAMQAEIYQAAGIGAGAVSEPQIEVSLASYGPSKCFIRVDQPYMYYVLEIAGSKAILSLEYFGGGGDGYTLQAFEYPKGNVTLYKDSYFGLILTVEQHGGIKLVSVNGGPTFDSKVCRAELDTTGLRPPTDQEVY